MTQNNPPDLNELVQSAQKMQKELNRVQSELAKKTVEGSAGGGMVTAVMNGRQQMVSIRIEREIVVSQDMEMLQDLIVAAVNQALSKASSLAQDELSQVAGSFTIKIPGLGT